MAGVFKPLAAVFQTRWDSWSEWYGCPLLSRRSCHAT